MNPFRYTEPVPSDELIDRDDEAATLLARASSANNSRLVAPRRYGKTSLLRRVRAEAELEGWATVAVDFFGVITLADVAERVERAYAEQLQGGLSAWFSGVRRTLRPTFRAGGGPVPAAVEVELDPQAQRPLLERLALPRRLFERHGTRVLVVFDEFQDVLAADRRADAIIRSEIQHHGDAASYVFAGSHVGMMRELFGDRRRAFYGQAGPVELPPLPSEAVAAHVAGRFAATRRDAGEALDPLLELAGGHPQRTMLLANALWERTRPGRPADFEAWFAARDRVLADLRDEFRAIWSGLPTGQRRVLTAVAENRAPLYASGGRAGSRGGAIATAAAALRDRGEIVSAPSARTRHRVVDPLLAAWLRGGRGDG